MLGTKTLHAHHREVAKLALLLNTHSGHAFKSFKDVLGILLGERLRGEHFGANGHVFHKMLGASASDYHLVEIHGIVVEHKIGTCALALFHVHNKLLNLIAHKACHHSLLAKGQVGQFKMAAPIAMGHKSCAFHLNSSIGQMLSGGFALHIAKKHGIGVVGRHAKREQNTK
ncbi:Uncharacterised protein [Chlamydia trachomatis]|nr:Uncharacterised protein [Chlamydia trachomatis]